MLALTMESNSALSPVRVLNVPILLLTTTGMSNDYCRRQAHLEQHENIKHQKHIAKFVFKSAELARAEPAYIRQVCMKNQLPLNLL